MEQSQLNAWPTEQLFTAISEQAVQAAGVTVSERVAIKEIPGRPEMILLIDKDGVHQEMQKSQPRRSNALLSCADVVEFARWFQNEGASPIIWISPEAIVVQDDKDRLRGDFARYDLKFTELFQAVTSLPRGCDGAGAFDQPSMLKLLRVTLARAFAENESRLSLIRTVRQLRTNRQSTMNNGSGSHEVGMLDQQSQVIEWPDSLRLVTTVFEDSAFTATWPIETCLDVRPEEQSGKIFTLNPLPADVVAARQGALDLASEVIRKQLAGDIPVFLGSPSRKS